MIAEYAYCYGGPPDPSMSWHLFLALLDRIGRFSARTTLGHLIASGHATVESASPLQAIAFPPVTPRFALKQSSD